MALNLSDSGYRAALGEGAWRLLAGCEGASVDVDVLDLPAHGWAIAGVA